MYDVTWRTGCTFTILVLLVWRGSGGLLEAPNPAPTALPTGEGMRSASYGAGPTTPEAGAALASGRGSASSLAATADARRLATRVLQVPRHDGGQAEVWR